MTNDFSSRFGVDPEPNRNAARLALQRAIREYLEEKGVTPLMTRMDGLSREFLNKPEIREVLEGLGEIVNEHGREFRIVPRDIFLDFVVTPERGRPAPDGPPRI